MNSKTFLIQQIVGIIVFIDEVSMTLIRSPYKHFHLYSPEQNYLGIFPVEVATLERPIGRKKYDFICK